MTAQSSRFACSVALGILASFTIGAAAFAAGESKGFLPQLAEYDSSTPLWTFNSSEQGLKQTPTQTGLGMLAIRRNQKLPVIRLANGQSGLKVSDSCLIARSIVAEEINLTEANDNTVMAIPSFRSMVEQYVSDQNPGIVMLTVIGGNQGLQSYLTLICRGFAKSRELITIADVNEKLGPAVTLYAKKIAGEDPNMKMNLDELNWNKIHDHIVFHADMNVIGYNRNGVSDVVEVRPSLTARPVYMNEERCLIEAYLDDSQNVEVEKHIPVLKAGAIYEIVRRGSSVPFHLFLSAEKRSGQGPANIWLSCTDISKEARVTELELKLGQKIDFTNKKAIEEAKEKQASVRRTSDSISSEEGLIRGAIRKLRERYGI